LRSTALVAGVSPLRGRRATDGAEEKTATPVGIDKLGEDGRREERPATVGGPYMSKRDWAMESGSFEERIRSEAFLAAFLIWVGCEWRCGRRRAGR